ncbi:MAG: PAS domain S-box protein [Methanomassiliicoccales archaeon]|nr:PAS domain S-box protein [Methanomassiliicoccales archaeon]
MRRSEWFSRFGFLPLLALIVATILLVGTGYRGPVFEPAYLALILQFIFVFGMGALLAVVSARAFLVSGSMNVLLIGVASIISGSLLAVAQWIATPQLGTPMINEATTMGNIGILVASALLLSSAIVTWTGKGVVLASHQRRDYLGAAVLFTAITMLLVFGSSELDLIPPFFTSSGSTLLRVGILSLSGLLLASGVLLFGLKYLRTRSSTLYWYTLGLVSFSLSLIGLVLTAKLGEAMNWCGRIGLYLAGLYFLFAIVSRDVSHRSDEKVSERWAEAFKNDSSQLVALFANMIDGFAYQRIITDETGKPIDYVFLEVNDAFEKITGVKKEDAVGQRVTKVMPGIENDPADWIGTYGRVALSGEPVRFESYSVQLKKWLEVSAYSPKYGHFVVLFEDTTERRGMEEKLREAKDFLENLIDYANAPIIVWGPDLRVTRFNHAFEHLTGYESSRVIGQPLDVLFPEDSRIGSMELIDRARQGEHWESVEIPIKRMDGTARTVLWNSATLFTPGTKQVMATIAQGQDITERKLAEENLKRSNAELQQFAYVASHDLQEPLRMVVNYLSLLDLRYKDLLDEKAKGYISYAVEGGTWMRALIDDLLSYSRVESQGKPFVPVDMNAVMTKTVETFSKSIEDAGASITWANLPVVIADETQILQVMHNLISNAIKFRGPEPLKVEVSCEAGTGENVFSVKDNGIGMNMNYSKQIFQMFQRLHTKDEYPGTGVGLAIAKRIIERHNGRIWVVSEEGKGATFFFSLPGSRIDR